MKSTYLGIIKHQDRNQYVLAWRIDLNGHSFDYYQGLGHIKQCRLKEIEDKSRVVSRWVPSDDCELNVQVANATGCLGKRNYLKVSATSFRSLDLSKRDSAFYILRPDNNQILTSLYLDSQSGQMSFDDFCDSMGYSNDSIKALDVYRQCMDTARKLKGFVFPDAVIKGEI